MIELGFYEKVVPIKAKAKHTAKKVVIGVVCALAVIIWLVSAIIAQASFVACFVVALVIAAVPFVVSSFTATELEYSVSSDSVSLAMIYGGKRRKEIFSAYPDDILLIAPATEDNVKKAEAYGLSEFYTAVTGEDASLPRWLIVFKDEKDRHYAFTFEAEDGIQKILKALKPSVISFR